jgi:SAM-dependent methyltransferase
MPTSPISTVAPVIQTALSLGPERILDLGIGTGKYGFLLREQIAYANKLPLRLVGVEGWPEYVGDHQRLVYDEIHIADIRDFLRDPGEERFDLALLLDVIEHFTPEDAQEVVSRALDIADVLIVSTPPVYYAQELDVELEHHLSWWPLPKLEELAERVGAQIDTAEIVHTAFAALSRTTTPELVYDSPTRALARTVRARLRPMRGAGPTI